MTAKVTSRDVQEIVSKLSSDKAKAREDGIKLLNTWLEGERSIVFCKYISEKSALLKPDELPHSETWPFIISLLAQCVTLEIQSSKKRLPKLGFAKTLRIVVQRAEDRKFSGKNLLLVPVVKLLFNHIWDVLRDVPSFQSEYGVILRHLLQVQHYRLHIRKRVYSGLVLLYMEKVETSLDVKTSSYSNPKEEVFRCILTLHSLLENPPGDFPADLRGDIVKSFIGIFCHIREEGKISRKLIECLNTYLLKDGPNLDSQNLEIHDSVQQFVFRCWLTTHDRSLKDALVLYARLQLNLTRVTGDGNALLEQLEEVLSKELDQMTTSSSNLPWNDITRDEKCGILTCSQQRFLELAAVVFWRACANTSKPASAEKRARREHMVVQVKDGLMNGKWSWHAAFCFLIRNYSSRIRKDLIIYWFESICASFDRIINDANVEHTYDGLLWTLRSLQRLSSLLLFPSSRGDLSPKSSFFMNEFGKFWHTIWSCTVRGLPIFSNITSVAEAALVLLRNMILSDKLITFSVPRDIWDLRLFTHLPSASVLCFVSCYFSSRASQGDLHEALHVRQNLLKAVLALLNWKESSMLNDQLVVMLPPAVYALCAGCAPLSHSVPEAGMNWVMAEEQEQENVHEFCELSVEVLASISHESTPQDFLPECCQNVRLPMKLRDLLCHEVETRTLEALKEIEIKKMLLSDIFLTCALLSNLIYCSCSMRHRDEKSYFLTKLGEYMIGLLDQSASILERTHNDIICGCAGSSPVFNSMDSIVASFNSFVSSPFFSKWRDKNDIDVVIYTGIVESIERLLKGLANLYDACSDNGKDVCSGVDLPDDFDNKMLQNDPADNSKSIIVDMELDVNSDSKDMDILNLDGKVTHGFAFSSENLKMDVLSFISSFFSVLPSLTWDTLFDLIEKDGNQRVLENLVSCLCQHPHWSSHRRVSELIMSLNNVVDMQANLKLQCIRTLDAICSLVRNILLARTAKDKNVSSLWDRISEEELISLGDLINKVDEKNLVDWCGRTKLIGCICDFVLLKPEIGQSMIEKLLGMLRDSDYRVRFCLAQRIGILFQTWDGHNELFQDICSNFGPRLVIFSKDRVVTAKEVLAAGPQAGSLLETTIITLMHLAVESEKIELEAVFMMSVVAAIDPSQRELVTAVLDNLSRELNYTSRAKYMEELIGPLLFWWVACGVSLVALVEIRDLFVSSVEPCNFILYCCQWLLPALLLNEDFSNLNWVAKIACQPLATLVKIHFVHVFSVCMALHCSKKTGWKKGSAVLESLILRIAEISENERDKLIKRHMVSIVNHLFSLAAASADPAPPLFSRDTIVHAIETVVDGFLEMEDRSRSAGLVDKINIFRPDRVFSFIVEMHYKVTAAAHQRHKCHRLGGIEVLVNVLGHRAGVSSSFIYLLNLVGQCIGRDALLNQCCRIISTLLKIYKDCPSDETTRVLGEQLQFLISKLVLCYSPYDNDGENPVACSSDVLPLLRELILHSDASLYEYIKELEPLPDLDMFSDIRKFHEELCLDYSAKNHLVNLAKRSLYLPPRVLVWSLQALHKRFFEEEACQGWKRAKLGFLNEYWHSDQDIVSAIWHLVRMCSLDDTDNFATLVSDFVSRVGIDDPHRVVLHLPGEISHAPRFEEDKAEKGTDRLVQLDTVVSDKLLNSLIRLLKKYLMDDSVKIIDMTSQALRGILSTEKGQRALLLFDQHEKSLIEVHSKGVNTELVQKLVSDLEAKFNAEAISLENSAMWKTRDKTFDMWVCPLVYGLIGYCDDIIIRLCQDICLVKSEVAELLFPSVMVNLAWRKDLDVDLCKLISFQVRENIFIESNTLMKSIKVMLDALNQLRLCHMLERSTSLPGSCKRENSKHTKASSYGSKSHSTSGKPKDNSSSRLVTSTLSWEKVYWLPIDYLVVAKSAINCGSYFTAVLYVEHWCEHHFDSLTLGSPDFSHLEILPSHIEILVSAVTQINEPDSLYGIIQSHKLTSQITMFEHEGNWTKALEHYDLLVQSGLKEPISGHPKSLSSDESQPVVPALLSKSKDQIMQKRPFKGLIRSLQQIGCTHVLDVYCQGLASLKGQLQHDLEFTELQYEAAWRAGNWDFSLLNGVATPVLDQKIKCGHFNENLHSCLRALEEGEFDEFHTKLRDSKKELLLSICHASKESTEYIYSAMVKLQIFYHVGMAWGLRWSMLCKKTVASSVTLRLSSEPIDPFMDQLSWLNKDWRRILEQAQLHMNLLEPFIAFRRVLFEILNCRDFKLQHLLEAASTLRKGIQFSQAAASLHEFKSLCTAMGKEHSNVYWHGRLEEAKLLRAQGQHEMAINLAKYIAQDSQFDDYTSDVFRLVGKWLAETRSSNSRTVLDKYLKHAVSLADNLKATDRKSIAKQCQMHFHLSHYADALYRTNEERLNSNEWQAAMRLRKFKAKELKALIKRLKSSSKGEQTEYSLKIQELQKQLAMDGEEEEKLQEDRDNFLTTALEGYKRCLVIGDEYDVRVVFRLVSLWFGLSPRPIVINGMISTIKEVQSHKFIPLAYQIASRMGSTKDQGPHSFQFALVSLVKKMAIEHPYHTIFQLLALANGDRIKEKQRSRNSFVADMDKKVAAENLLIELHSYHGDVIRQMKQMVEIYIKLAEMETKREDTNRKVTLPRDIRSVRELELVPVITSNFPVDRSCQYCEGSFPHFKGFTDSVTVMNGINAPKAVECLGSDGKMYRQLAKSGNDDLRQDAVMEQFFSLVNTFLQNHRETWKRRLRIHTYKVVPFTPCAGVIEWVTGTVPLGDYLTGSSSTRNGGAHGRYGQGDWTFLKCRHHMATESDKRRAFQEVCENFRPVMHYFFLERFLHPANWFEKRLAYTRSVATSSMVGYIVGLGDRHSMNILIDQATAEVVHIDLGVAFEQGLMLKTPERVPFRLTRDIIDGMGVTGVEGVFRRCCEETLSVMRANKEALLTIVEVFIHDPLYKWALSPLKALQRQKETDYDLETSLEGSEEDEYEGNKDAARALLRVKQKLDGYEEGEMRSVRGQVQQLVQDAIDPDRLSQMFPGWGAWM
nr:serine/threonine-protein kinase ATM isoform X2 [Coffea arabica]